MPADRVRFMTRLLVVAICVLAGFCSVARPALAEKRVALVIGNSAYPDGLLLCEGKTEVLAGG